MSDFSDFIKEITQAETSAVRVLRKSLFLAACYSLAISYYRHFLLGLGFGKSFLVTLCIALLLVFWIGLVGGCGAGQLLHLAERKWAPMQRHTRGARVAVEWAFALLAPILAALIAYSLSLGPRA